MIPPTFLLSRISSTRKTPFGRDLWTGLESRGSALAFVVPKDEWRRVKPSLRCRRSCWWEGIMCGVGAGLSGSLALALDEFRVAGRAEADCTGLLEDGADGTVGAGVDGESIIAIGATISVELDRIKANFHRVVTVNAAVFQLQSSRAPSALRIIPVPLSATLCEKKLELFRKAADDRGRR